MSRRERHRVRPEALLALTAAAGICAALAGCASGGTARAPAASTVATRQAGSQPHGHVIRHARASTASAAAGNGTSATHASQPTLAQAPAASSPAANPVASGRNVPLTLTSGLYTDAPDGTSHYVLSFAPSAGSAVKGSVSYLYTDGRIATVGSYAGTLSSGGQLTLALGDGRVLSGHYKAGRLNLASCAAALPLTSAAAGCAFTYHGHVP
jgi:hypothetical protein